MFNLDLLKEALYKHIKFNVRYSFLIKICKGENEFGMAGHQISFECDYNNYDEKMKILYKNFMDNIAEFKKEYFACNIEYIQLMFITVRSFPKLKLTNINNLNLDKELTNIGETKRDLNNSILPLTQPTLQCYDFAPV